jgi:hypothetical protein
MLRVEAVAMPYYAWGWITEYVQYVRNRPTNSPLCTKMRSDNAVRTSCAAAR